MPPTTSRRRLTTAAVVLAVAALLALTAWLLTRPDPEETVAPVVVDEVSAAPPVPGQAGPAQEQIEALDRLTGDLRHGGDTAEFVLDDIELDFGPDAWVLTAPATADFDGNGTVEPLLTELQALVGKPVTAMVRLDEDGDDADVFVLNERTYRDSTGANLPWQPVETTGTPVSAEVVRSAATRAVGSGARVTELERVRAGRVAWEATVVDDRGGEHSVLLGADGAVLDLRKAD
ncbi:hypothetical protein GCM10022197_32460 [Microlunatus spumicola]|uniref:Peptidase propeptide and YPEB domain-containing protein n=1 Tax=Microlunatus spumicola TaxID=81499 RepID=A0ABP6XVB0_9ACTN